MKAKCKRRDMKSGKDREWHQKPGKKKKKTSRKQKQKKNSKKAKTQFNE